MGEEKLWKFGTSFEIVWPLIWTALVKWQKGIIEAAKKLQKTTERTERWSGLLFQQNRNSYQNYTSNVWRIPKSSAFAGNKVDIWVRILLELASEISSWLQNSSKIPIGNAVDVYKRNGNYHNWF